MKLSETFKKALNRGGWLTVGIYVGTIVVIGIVFGSFAMGTLGSVGVFSMLAGGRGGSAALMRDLARAGGWLLVLGLLALTALVFSDAAALGSMRDAAEGKPVSLRTYLARGRELFWRYLDYALLYGAPYGVLAILVIVILNPGLFRAISTRNLLALARGNFAIAMLVVNAIYYFGLIPLVTLKVAGYPVKATFTRHVGEFALGALVVYVTVRYAPLVGVVTLPLFRLYVLSAVQDDNAPALEAAAADGSDTVA